jgi:uncharacterized protein (TIGR03435 family)
MNYSKFIALAGLVTGAALCQPAPGATPLAFEVATVKTVPPPSAMGGQVRIRVGVSNDGAIVNYSNLTLKDLVQNAYGVKDYQVTGADWMSTQRFEISAKIPDGASKDQAPEMLQTLLKERFKLTVHSEKKDHPVYALVVGKSGAKLKAAEVDPDAAAPGDPGKAPSPPAGPGGGRGGGGRGMNMQMTPNGGHVEAKAVTVAAFAEMISRFLDRPVVDQTAIAGDYDFAVDISQDDMANMRGMQKGGMMMMGGGGGRGPDGPGPGAGAPPSGPEGGSVFQSVQQYGLKLEPKKTAMDMITIDSAEKTPTEN